MQMTLDWGRFSNANMQGHARELRRARGMARRAPAVSTPRTSTGMSGGTLAATQRLGVLKCHMVLSSHPASLSVEEALRRLPGGDGPGDPGIPTAADPNAIMSVFILAGQSSMAGRGMLPEFQTLNPDILGASSSGLPACLQTSPRLHAMRQTRSDCWLPERRFLLPFTPSSTC